MENQLINAVLALSFSILAVCADVPVFNRSDTLCAEGGTCVQKSQCYNLHKAENMTIDVFLFSCRDEPDWVCCPAPRPRALFEQSPDFNKRLLPLDHCGLANENRISGGEEAELGQFPWMALIAFSVNGSGGALEYRCGGSLISNRYVLTAAHCMNYGIPVSVRLGEHDISKSADCEEYYCADPPIDVQVEEAVSHEKYNTPLLKNDIALLRLRTRVSTTEFISPICLPFGINITGEENKRYTVAGWGRVQRTNPKGSRILLFTRVLSNPVSKCTKSQPREVRPIGDLQLCAGDLSVSDVCKGDSGGPMMDTIVKNGTARTYQVGIVSFGYTSCGGNTPSVYTRVNAYLPWILSNLEP